MCFVDLEKAFDRVFEWALKKKEIPVVLGRSVMSLYEGAKTRVKVDSELSEEFEARVGMHVMTCIIIDLYLYCLVSQRF